MAVAIPLKLAAGVKVTTPEAFTVYVPCLETVKVVWIPKVAGSKSTVATSIVPSTSVSSLTILNETGVSSVVVAVLLTATGASFTAVTVTVIVAVFETAPLLSFTV